MPWAMPPSSCPRACTGLRTVPASKPCTLWRMRISPVTRCTAMRNPWARKAVERRGLVELPQRQHPAPAEHLVLFEAALFDRHAADLAGQLEEVVSQGFRG